MSSTKEVTVNELAQKLGIDPPRATQVAAGRRARRGRQGKRYTFSPPKAGQLARKYEAAQEGSDAS